MLSKMLALGLLLSSCATVEPKDPYPHLFMGRSVPCQYEPYRRIDTKLDWDLNWTSAPYEDDEVMRYPVPKCADGCPEEEETHYFNPW